MKKLKAKCASILRGALFLTPGIGFAVRYWHSVPPMINILAAIGVESICGISLLFYIAIRAQIRSRRQSREIEPH